MIQKKVKYTPVLSGRSYRVIILKKIHGFKKMWRIVAIFKAFSSSPALYITQLTSSASG